MNLLDSIPDLLVVRPVTLACVLAGGVGAGVVIGYANRRVLERFLKGLWQ